MKEIMKLKVPVLMLSLAASMAMAQQAAEPAAPEEKVEEVKISTTRDPEFKFYRPFVLGLDTFDKHRQLAPAAPLRFVLLSNEVQPSYEGVAMRIAGNERSIAIPIAADGTFAMPRDQAMADENGEIILNRKKGTFRWRPHIRTPGVPDDARRLGDLRLECELRWAIEKSEFGFFARTAISALGGACESKRVRMLSQPPRQIKGAFMMVNGARIELDAKIIGNTKGRAYVPPMYDKSLPDDTIIQFEFVEPSKP
jgi:hypothetical protein